MRYTVSVFAWMKPMHSLASRIATVTVAMVTLAVILAVGGAWLIGQRVADAAVTDSLSASQSIQRYLQSSTAREVALTSDLIASDPHFTAYLVEAVRGGLGEEQAIDVRSILDQVDERRREMGFDFAMMLDADGRVLVRTDRPEPARESRANQPLVASVMADLIPDYGPWREGNRLYSAAVVPITTAFELIGFLITGMLIDDEVAAGIKRVTGVDTLFVTLSAQGPALAASTLDLRRNERLLALLAGTRLDSLLQGQAIDRLDVDFDGESWVARVEPIVDGGGTVLGAALTIDSLDARLAGHRAIQTSLLAAGIGAVLLALILSILVARRIARPVSGLASIADRAAQGNYDQTIVIKGKDEVATLGRAISRLLADLREQQEIAGYVSDLSRHLGETGPDQDAESRPMPAPTNAPESGPARVLALQWLGSTDDQGGSAMKALESWLQTLNQWSLQYDASLVPGGSTRIYLVFKQDNSLGLLRCLAALLEGVRDKPAAPAMALASGEIISCSIDLEANRNHFIAGKPVIHCERLLSEAGPGRLLLSPTAHETVAKDLRPHGAEISVTLGRKSGKKFYWLKQLPVSDPDATEVAPRRPSAAPGEGRSLHPGSVLDNRFEVLARLGSGAMGTVFKARDRKLDDIVALKVLQPGLLSDPDFLERTKSEIRLARRITHPNVLRTHDFWEIDGLPLITMEYVRGITLAQLVERSGRLKLAAGLRVCSQILQGLHAAHKAGVLHRDIKPANIILDQSGNARLMDFGIARQTLDKSSKLTQPGNMIGTPNYMAPEIILGKTVDERSDIYAMGVLMNEIFTGQLPLQGETSMAVCLAHVQEQPIAPSSLWPEIPETLEKIILTCLAKEPDQRYQDAESLLRSLIQLRRQSAAASGP
ncbi:MAG: HAMP domain-containing protein [Wenzhouxiangella sp.]|nr:MAG: HAMP domain-containing protein [Wenzhouxiangella sp.]